MAHSPYTKIFWVMDTVLHACYGLTAIAFGVCEPSSSVSDWLVNTGTSLVLIHICTMLATVWPRNQLMWVWSLEILRRSAALACVVSGLSTKEWGWVIPIEAFFEMYVVFLICWESVGWTVLVRWIVPKSLGESFPCPFNPRPHTD